MSVAEKLKKIAENEQKVFDAGYAKGKAEGGASDPTAEAVMSLLSRCHNNIAGDWTSSPPDGVFVCGGDGQNQTFCIIPPNITDIYGYGFLSNLITLGGSGTTILSLPSAPPFPRSDSLVWDSSHRPKVIYVPDKSVEAYRVAAQWSEFADVIEPMSNLTVEVKFVDVHIGDTIYQMPLGMTWREWINSEYYYQEASGSGTFSYIDINEHANYVGFGPGGVMCMLYPDTMDIVRPDDIIDPAIHYQSE